MTFLPPVQTLDQFQQLLNALAKPDDAKKMLADLKAATEEANKSQAEAARAQQELANNRSDVTAVRKDADARMERVLEAEAGLVEEKDRHRKYVLEKEAQLAQLGRDMDEERRVCDLDIATKLSAADAELEQKKNELMHLQREVDKAEAKLKDLNHRIEEWKKTV